MCRAFSPRRGYNPYGRRGRCERKRNCPRPGSSGRGTCDTGGGCRAGAGESQTTGKRGLEGYGGGALPRRGRVAGDRPAEGGGQDVHIRFCPALPAGAQKKRRLSRERRRGSYFSLNTQFFWKEKLTKKRRVSTRIFTRESPQPEVWKSRVKKSTSTKDRVSWTKQRV